MLAGHGLHAAIATAFAGASSAGGTHGAAAQFGPLSAGFGAHFNSGTLTTLKTELTDSAGTATGTATYFTGTVDGEALTEFKLTVTGATANSTFDVAVAGTVVGQITTDGNGDGKLVLSSNPRADQTQLPDNFPTDIASGTGVTVSTLSGTLATPTRGGHGCGSTDGSSLSATLADSEGSAKGSVKYSTHTDRDGDTTTKLKVTVTDAAADTTLDVAIDGTVVGQVVTDGTGAGSLTLSSNPTDGETQLPDNFPTKISAGSAVTVGSLTGTFAARTTHEHGFRGFFGRWR